MQNNQQPRPDNDLHELKQIGEEKNGPEGGKSTTCIANNIILKGSINPLGQVH